MIKEKATITRLMVGTTNTFSFLFLGQRRGRPESCQCDKAKRVAPVGPGVVGWKER